MSLSDKSPLDQMLDRQKQANSAVPLADPRISRTKVQTLPDRVAAGDVAAIAPLLESLVASGEAFCRLVESLPSVDTSTPEGKLLETVQRTHLPKLRAVYAEINNAIP